MNMIKKLKLNLLIKWSLLFSINFISFAKINENRTKYFRIVYQEENVEFASWMYHNIDAILEENLELFSIPKPTKPITIFLPSGLTMNAEVNVFRENLITIYPNHIKTIYKFENYIETIFRHELIHLLINRVVPMRVAVGSPLSWMVPSWFHEGAAVLEENGREKENNFTNIVRNFDNLSMGAANINTFLCYPIGYSILAFIRKEIGKEAYYRGFSRRIKSITIQTLPFLGGLGMIDKWVKSVKPKKIIGTKYISDKVDLVSSSNNKLIYRYFHQSGFFTNNENTIIEEDFEKGTKKILTRPGLFNLSIDGDDIAEVMGFTIRETFSRRGHAAYLNGKLLHIENPVIVVKSGDDLLYTTRNSGKDTLISKNRGVILEADEDIAVFNIMPYKDRIFISGVDYYEGTAHIFEIRDNEIIAISETYNASINGGKIYFSKDIEDEVGIFEYDIEKDKLFLLASSATADNINRVQDKIFLTQFDNGNPNLFFLEYDELEKIEYPIKREYINRKEHKLSRISERKEMLIEKGRYIPHFYPRIPSISFSDMGIELIQPIISDIDHINLSYGINIPINRNYPTYKIIFNYGMFKSSFSLDPFNNVYSIKELTISHSTFSKMLRMRFTYVASINNIKYGEKEGFTNSHMATSISSSLAFNIWQISCFYSFLNAKHFGSGIISLSANNHSFYALYTPNRSTADVKITSMITGNMSFEIFNSLVGLLPSNLILGFKTYRWTFIASRKFNFGIPINLHTVGEAFISLNRIDFDIELFMLFLNKPTIAIRYDVKARLVHYNRYSTDIVFSLLNISSHSQYSIGIRFNFSNSG